MNEAAVFDLLWVGIVYWDCLGFDEGPETLTSELPWAIPTDYLPARFDLPSSTSKPDN
jgi:hypothetical protein